MIRVGIIGAGFMGRNHFNQYERMPERCRVVALCDREADRRVGDWSKVGGNVGDMQGTKRDLSGVRPYVEWKELVHAPDVDALDVCVPTFTHREIVVAALRAGKHVLCEKPMALTVEDCDAMLEAAERSKAQLMIAQVIRFWPEYVYLKDAFDDRRFGALLALHLRRQAEAPMYTLNNWVHNPQLSGGAILDLHIHDVDYALWLLDKPRAVRAQGYRRSSGAIDRVHATWDYGPDLVVQLEGFWDIPAGFGFNMGLTAVFERAALLWDYATTKPLTVFRPGQPPEVPALPPAAGYFAEIDYFLACVEGNHSPTITTPRQSRDAVELALAEKQSVLTGQAVQIPG